MQCEQRQRRRLDVTTCRRTGDDRRQDERRTAPVWFKQDAAGIATGASRRLGRLHGPAGPLVLVHLKGCAKLQEGFHARKGVLKIAWDELADAVFCDEQTARAIVATLVEMEEAEIVADRGWKATLFLVGYESEQDTPSMSPSARRMRDKRARDTAQAADQTPSPEPHAPSPEPHTPSHVTPGDAEVEGEVEGETEAHASAAASREPARAREPLPGPDEAEAAGLHPALAQVVAILQAARDPDGRQPIVHDTAVNSALHANARGDIELAVTGAHETAAMIQDGRASSPHAAGLLGGVLRRLTTTPPGRRGHPPPRRNPSPADRERDDRRARRAAALQAELEGAP